MTYLDIRNEAVRQIEKHFADRNIQIKVEASAGALNEEEIRRLFIKTPAIHICLSDITINDDGVNGYLTFVAYVVVQANQKDRIYDKGLLLVGSLLSCIKVLDSANWGFSTSDISSQCLYSCSLDKINACLWACSWKWRIRVGNIDGEINDTSILEDFEGYEATHIVDKNKATDIVELINKKNKE